MSSTAKESAVLAHCKEVAVVMPEEFHEVEPWALGSNPMMICDHFHKPGLPTNRSKSEWSRWESGQTKKALSWQKVHKTEVTCANRYLKEFILDSSDKFRLLSLTTTRNQHNLYAKTRTELLGKVRLISNRVCAHLHTGILRRARSRSEHRRVKIIK